MAGYRDWAERELMKAEAELRVRSGQSRADVSRELGIPLITLAQWACQGGWRKKDIEAERNPHRVREVGERLLRLREVSREKREAMAAALAAAEERLAIGGERPPALPRPDDWEARVEDVWEGKVAD